MSVSVEQTIWNEADPEWKTTIYKRVTELNNSYQFTNDWVERINRLSKENVRLKREIDELKANSKSLASQDTFNAIIEELRSTQKGEHSDKCSVSEHRNIQRQLDELRKVHSGCQEKLNSLKAENNSLLETRVMLLKRDEEVQRLKSELAEVTAARDDLSKKYSELRNEFTVVSDDRTSWKVTYDGLNKQYKKMEAENRHMFKQIQELQTKIADMLNKELADFNAIKVREREEMLKRAAAEYVEVQDVDAKRVSHDEGVGGSVGISWVPTTLKTKFQAHEGDVGACAWARSEPMFATAGSDRMVKLWHYSPADGKAQQRFVLAGANYGFLSVEFDPTDQMVIAGSCDSIIRIWNTVTGRLQECLNSHCTKVTAAHFVANTKKVVSSSEDRTIKLWDLNRRSCVKSLFSPSYIFDMAIHGENTYVSGHHDSQVRFWDGRSGQPVNHIQLPDRVSSVCVSVDCNQLVATARDPTNVLKIIDIRKFSVIETLSAANHDSFCIEKYTRARYSPDSRYIACGSHDGRVYVWNDRYQLESPLEKGHDGNGVTAVSWSSFGLISVDKAKHCAVWV